MIQRILQTLKVVELIEVLPNAKEQKDHDKLINTFQRFDDPEIVGTDYISNFNKLLQIL